MVDLEDMFEEALEGRISELESRIQAAREAYYNDTPTISDSEFDALVDDLKGLKADSPAVTAVGAPLPGNTAWPKVAHTIPMGSLEKVQTPAEMLSWVDKAGPGKNLLITEKLDGISISVEYRKGRLFQAVTRGDGLQGEVITPNVAKMRGIRVQLPSSESVTLRGEIVLHKSDHQKYFSDKANPRNAASGTAKRLDGKGSEHLTVYFYQVWGKDFDTETAQYDWLHERGFKTPHWFTTASGLYTPLTLWGEYQRFIRDSLDYEIDGLVVRFDDLDFQLSLGELHGRPKGAVAFKFLAEEKVTTLRDVLWQVGCTGRLTPVAVFDEVSLVGANVTQASLYSAGYLRTMGLAVGDKVVVVRSNDVIPKVIKKIEEERPQKINLTLPTECPECHYSLENDGEHVVCPNTAECSAQVEGRLKKWVSELGILEWGDALIEKVVQAGLATSVEGLYRLSEADLAGLDRMGASSAKKAREQLWGVLPIPLEQFLGALGIPLCATSTLELVVQAGYDTVAKIEAATIEQLTAISGVGPKRARALAGWFKRNPTLVEGVLETGVTLKERIVGTLTGKSFCFTGKMQNKRPTLERMVKEAGGQVKGSVGKGLTYLVISDPNSTSAKATMARKNGTSCISEEAFLAMVGV